MGPRGSVSGASHSGLCSLDGYFGACGEELAVLVGGREALEAGAQDLQSSVAGVHAICGGPGLPLSYLCSD